MTQVEMEAQTRGSAATSRVTSRGDGSDHSVLDVCLVSMPYVDLQRPSMGLGLLQGILDEAGINAMVAYANVWFADKVGLRLYELAAQAPTTHLAGEWTFAGAAFSDRGDRDERYLNLVREAGGQFGTEDTVADLRTLRAAAEEFVDETARRVLATGARVVGCTSTFEQHVGSLALLRRIRELDPDVVTMMGGANCETVMGEATHRCFPWVDYVVSGEADGLITDLCKLALSRGREVECDELPHGVLGPCHRHKAGSQLAQKQTSRTLFRDLDSLPIPLFDDYFKAVADSSLGRNIRPGLPLETSRGCWWGNKHQCTFCGLNGSGMTFRSKGPERVLNEIATLESRHGISNFEVVDNILDTRYFKTLLPSLAESDSRRSLFYEIKANISRQQVELLARAGIKWVQPGIESLHSEVLQLMDKGLQGWQNVQLLKWSRELGIRLSWSLLWGFPGERDEYYQEMAGWLPLLEHLQPPLAVIPLRYDRYSVYHARAEELGMVLFPIPAMSYVYPVPSRELGNLAYFFTTDPDRSRLIVFDKGTVGPGVAAVYEATSHWSTAFYSRKSPVLSMADREGVLDVVDTRSCSRGRRRSFQGLERAVLLACDAVPRPEKIAELVRRDHGLTASPEEVSDAVDRLASDGLILRMDNRLVGLAIEGKVPAQPSFAEFPGGMVKVSNAASEGR